MEYVTSRFRHQTLDEKRAEFNTALTQAVEQGIYPTSGRIPTNCFESVTRVAEAFPEAEPDLIAQATQDFNDYVQWRRDVR